MGWRGGLKTGLLLLLALSGCDSKLNIITQNNQISNFNTTIQTTVVQNGAPSNGTVEASASPEADQSPVTQPTSRAIPTAVLSALPTATPLPARTPMPTTTPLPAPIPLATPTPPVGAITNSLGMTFVPIAAGVFLMGSPTDEEDRMVTENQHAVTLTQDYYLQMTEVTQEQWQAVMGTNPSFFKAGANYPVDYVSWTDVQKFIQRLNQRGEGTYRLPTEAEWEYAARAGTTTVWFCGSNESCLEQVAWYYGNSATTHPVGQKKPNAWGLYDMHGNVSEWVQDWFGVYPETDTKDPQGNQIGFSRVHRGGGWDSQPWQARSAKRDIDIPSIQNFAIGFRLVFQPLQTAKPVPGATPSALPTTMVTPSPTSTPTPIPTIAPSVIPTATPLSTPTPPGGAITNSLGMTFVPIAAGTFQMGSPTSEPNRRSWDETQHTVTLTQGYYMQITEVTQGQWQAVMGSNPSFFKNGVHYPVEQVNWDDIQTFIQLLNQRGEGSYRLPTEAEWEYAARAGTNTTWSCGNSENCLAQVAWYNLNSSKQTHPVGQKQANAWGLYDMHGNVWEWVHDWYGEYSIEAISNPQGPLTGAYHIHRGGSWEHYAHDARSAIRYIYSEPTHHYDLGFRLVREQ